MEIIAFAMALFLGFAGCSRSASHQQDGMESDMQEDFILPERCGNDMCEEAEDQFGCPADCGAVAISAGGDHTCVLLSDGTARCWGKNESGQLGNGTNTDSNVPVAITGLTGAMSISGGDFVYCSESCVYAGHTCVLLSNGTAQCWGDNWYGQLGNETNTDSYVPVAVTGLTVAVAISAWAPHTCALISDGTARCWGCNLFGQLGDGTSGAFRVPPVAVTGLTGAVAVSAGYFYTCALLSDGTACCWGDNWRGQLGNGTNTDSNVPVAVTGLTGAVAVSAGGAHTCSLLSDGTVMCWGDNGYGQFGDGSNTDSNVPVAVTGLSGAVAVSGGWGHTCALLSDCTARCWGWNEYGQLGDGTNTDSNVPVTVLGLTGAVAISAGKESACALLSDGTAWCWGWNEYGQLGDGTNTDSNVPVPVSAW